MRAFLSGLALAALTVAPLSAQTGAPSQQGGGAKTPAPAAMLPAVGTMAPDFTAMIAGKDGPVATPFTLSKARGKVVVLAFYPKDRSSGCTIELTKFTTDYAKLFGKDVIVLPISKDNLASHAGWAKDAGMPFNIIADTTGAVATLYGSVAMPGAAFTRNLFVIGKDGKIVYSVNKLNVGSEDTYTQMAAAIAAANK